MQGQGVEQRPIIPGISPDCQGCAKRLPVPDNNFPDPYYPCKAVDTANDGTLTLPKRGADGICTSYQPNLPTSLGNHSRDLLERIHSTMNSLGSRMPPF